MGQAVLETLQTSEEVEGFESIELSSVCSRRRMWGNIMTMSSLSLLSSSPSSPLLVPTIKNEMDSSTSTKNEEDKEDNSNSKDNWEENIGAENIKNNSFKDEDDLNLYCAG